MINSEFSEQPEYKKKFDPYLICKLWLMIASPVILIIIILLYVNYIDNYKYVGYIMLGISMAFLIRRFIKHNILER